jgi:hypothetical protein
MIDINYIKSNSLILDRRIFFHNEVTIPIEPFQKTLAQLFSHAKIFTSTSEAKRNGWDKSIPDGFSQFIIGKRRNKITIFKEKTI